MEVNVQKVKRSVQDYVHLLDGDGGKNNYICIVPVTCSINLASSHEPQAN